MGNFLDSIVRPAEREDIPSLIQLLRIGAGGVIDAVYCGSIDAQSGVQEQLIDEALTRRFTREGTVTSFENCTVVEYQGEVIGHLIAYPMDADQHGPADPCIPTERLKYLQPLKELRAPGSFYISSLAVLPGYQGQGIGSGLLSLAGTQAKERALPRLSLHVFEQNGRAVKLYLRHKFKIVDRRAVIPHALIRFTGEFLLMTSNL